MTHNPLVVGSNPTGPITQDAENKALTETDKPSTESEKQNLAEILFLESELDADLRLLVQRWPKLSVELRSAIVKMVR